MSNLRGHHIDSVVSELKADLLSRLLVRIAVNAIAVATIDRCFVASELLMTLARVGRLQLMRAFRPSR
ncbi:hypothetical protein CXQ82_26920 [Pseudomonas sp. S09G 359]|nr:hypothetical protein CXQ82_26920 [Pseudomonas sp. S09G 359]